ncbi:MAG TPA: 3-deoxy-8-phosphooctulonate synthase [Thermodesulfobacteriota bacterium]|nr:3-deoxy-8-phosphooctulonate synthase [Thermodesulfobacteriota bacterium]
MKEVRIGEIRIGNGNPLVLIAGPCVIENEEVTLETARRLKEICADLNIPFIFKSSFDKANRTSLSSFRGPGIEKGLKILEDIRKKLSVPVMSDIHSVDQVKPASEVLDLLQIPAFLCRQTDLILLSSKTGKPVNVKKGQFLSPWDVKNIIEKFVSTGNTKLLITERGTSFGYNNLVVDFRGMPIIRSFGYPVIFDVTHSLQLPGGQGDRSGGQREFAAPLMRAGVGAGVDGLFIEVHPEPGRALCDGANMIPLAEMKGLLKQAKAIHDLVAKGEGA